MLFARCLGGSGWAVVVATLGLGCASSPGRREVSHGLVRPGTPTEVDIVKARGRHGPRVFAWEAYGAAAFEKARREKKPILLMGSASWCHWCHVMDETTYRNEDVGRLIERHFVAIRVDIDAWPDIAERYGEWGWPATILLSSEAEEIGKYRGYIDSERFIPILRMVVDKPTVRDSSLMVDVGNQRPSVEALPWIAAHTLVKMDDWYDAAQGSWGFQQKVPIGENIIVELRRAAHGDKKALGRAVYTLEKQRVMIDPVWGGVYQYSSAAHWNAPHYEKLMALQTANIEAYALGYAQTGRKDFLEEARKIARYLMTMLSSAEGGFYTNQDADVGSHDEGGFFVDGDVYYRLGDAARRKLGMPHIDEHMYAYENGLAIAALCTLYRVSGEADVLVRAVRAGELIWKSHGGDEGLLRHDATQQSPVRYLVDSASFGLAMVRLHEATKASVWRDRAERLAASLEGRLLDAETGALWVQTADASAAGVFAERQRSFGGNVLAARLYAAVGGEYRSKAIRTLVGVSTPRAVVGQGRMVGDYVLALDEVGIITWRP